MGNKLVYGVGISDANYTVKIQSELPKVNGERRRKLIWTCPFYQKWVGVLERCYSIKFKEKWPTYAGCLLSDKWIRFSDFREWMTGQDWEGKELDKDILVQGNREYGPETCLFVSKEVNCLLLGSEGKRGDCLLGVNWCKRDGKFRSRIAVNSKQKYLGLFTTQQAAHAVWQMTKLGIVYDVAQEQIDERLKDALLLRCNQLQYDIDNGLETIKL